MAFGLCPCLSLSSLLTVSEHGLADVLGLPSERDDHTGDVTIREDLAYIVEIRYRTLRKNRRRNVWRTQRQRHREKRDLRAGERVLPTLKTSCTYHEHDARNPSSDPPPESDHNLAECWFIVELYLVCDGYTLAMILHLLSTARCATFESLSAPGPTSVTVR